jgi:sugar phosphate isomerase/epimerase
VTPALLATTWTTAGDAAPYPGRHVSPIPLPRRIEAAARAGFTAFGLLDYDVRQFLETSDLTTLGAMLRDGGMELLELEYLTRWWTTGAERAESDGARAFLFAVAEALGVHHVKVAPDLDDPAPPDIAFWAESFHDLAADAAEHGTRVALEFLPMANIGTLELARDVVAAAGHPAGGLLVDIWHLERSGAQPDDVRRLPAQLLLAVELDDGPATPTGDPYDDTCHRRMLPGRGDFRVAEFAAALMDVGFAGPWGVEIISEDYRHRPLDKALHDVVATTRAVLAQAKEMRSNGTRT